MESVGYRKSFNSSQPLEGSPRTTMEMPSRFHFSWKLCQTISIQPITTALELTTRFIKLITWDISKTGVLKVFGYHNEASAFLEYNYLKTVIKVRDLLFIPTVAFSAFKDIIGTRTHVLGKLQVKSPEDYLKIDYTKKFDLFSSYMYSRRTFELIQPSNITPFAAELDGSLNTVMASHFLKPDVMAINFGIPNVATFCTEAEEDGSTQTVKVDAKSLKRDKMSFHITNGKIQSGIFFVPTNLPAEALQRFKEAARKMEGRADATCVNTNCFVLKEAGFSIEGKEMEDIIFPTTFMEHLLFRPVFYTDQEGNKHQVHFDIINTTKQSLQEHFEKIDMAVIGTRLRHQKRNASTEEERKMRGVAAKALIAEEKARLAQILPLEQDKRDLTRRKVTVSVPSCIGDVVASIWGRHIFYEVDLSDKKVEIEQAFQGECKLSAFPHKQPNLVTRIKRDLLFSGPVINFLHRHIMGREDTIYLHTQDLFNHLKSTEGASLNYVILDDKVVLAKINPNGETKELHRKVSDWVLSKHALLAQRKSVYCSGELYYDKVNNRFIMNRDSGTYMPNENQLKMAVNLVNEIFETTNGNKFEIAESAEIE